MPTYSPDKATNLIVSGKLPEGATVVGNLSLHKFTSIRSLPKGLNVIGCLNLYGCNSIKELPTGLVVDGYLNLKGCTSLKTLPRDLVVCGRTLLFVCLNLQGCTSLKLPQGIPEGVKRGVYADEYFFKSNKDYLLLMTNCMWHDKVKDSYMKALEQ